MHPSQWAKAIYQKRARKDFLLILLLLLLCGMAILIGNCIKAGETPALPGKSAIGNLQS